MKSITNIYNLIAVILIALLAACSGKQENKSEQLQELQKQQTELATKIEALKKEIAKETPTNKVVKAKEVVAKAVAPRAFDHYIKTQGFIESRENISVSAKSAGVVTQVFVREGQEVAAGQVLAQIDNSLINRSIDEVKSQLSLANTVYDRQQNLWEQKIGTEVQYLQAKNNKESLERRLASLNEQNDMSRIKAPVSGVVDEVDVKEGQNIAPGMPALRIVNNSDLKLKADVSEAYVSEIKKGDKVIVSVPDLKKDFNTQVTFVGRNINALSRTFTLEAKLPSSSELRPNMTAIIKIVHDSYSSAIVVPVNVVQDINNEKVVYIAEEKNNQTVATKKVVELLGVYDDLAHVNGLQAGDRIITIGYQGLSDGQIIKIQ